MNQNFFLFIPVVNRLDLLSLAYNSVRTAFNEIVIVNNSSFTDKKIFEALGVENKASIMTPPVPLTFAQTQNWMRKTAIEKGFSWYAFMHNDAEAQGDTAGKLIDAVTYIDTPSWGVVFTHYDTLCAFNVKAVKEVGEWDTNIPWYFGDNDYYKRIRLAGYKTIDTGLPVTHRPSSTVNSDSRIAIANSASFDLYAQYYRRKWGALDTEKDKDGSPMPQFTKPFNKALL